MWLKHIFIQMDLSHVFLQNGIKKIQHQPILHSRYPGRVYSRFQKSPILKVA